MHEIKLIRLQSGEDIICTCHEDLETKMVMLKDPMTVIYKRIKNGSILLISPWLPAELIEDNTEHRDNNSCQALSQAKRR